jgi:PAS domain S-box-containing protein
MKRFQGQKDRMRPSRAVAWFEVCKDAAPTGRRYRLLASNSSFLRLTGLNARKEDGLQEILSEVERVWRGGGRAAHANARGPRAAAACGREGAERLAAEGPADAALPPIEGRFAVVVTESPMEASPMAGERSFGRSFFHAIVEDANDGILIATSAESPYAYANRRAGDLTGYAPSELCRIGPLQLIHPSDHQLVKGLLERRLQGRLQPERYEITIRRKDGEPLPVEFSGSRTTWEGRPAALILMRDMSLRKRIEQERMRLSQDLERRVVERTLQLQEALAKLDQKQRELIAHKSDLERATRELVQTNTALSVLARNIDRKSGELENRIARSVSSRIMPLIDELSRDIAAERTRVKLEVLAACLKELTPGISRGREVIASLSATELRVAVMIKKSFRTNEIARLLHISPETVKTHRRSIRKKLGVAHSAINLSSYLMQKLGRD